jgi:hypothetical protein
MSYHQNLRQTALASEVLMDMTSRVPSDGQHNKAMQESKVLKEHLLFDVSLWSSLSSSLVRHLMVGLLELFSNLAPLLEHQSAENHSLLH